MLSTKMKEYVSACFTGIWVQSHEHVDALRQRRDVGNTAASLDRIGTGLDHVEVVAVEPVSSPVLSGGEPGPHRIQGIGAGFVPQILDIYLIDEIVQVKDDDAWETARQLCRHDGLMVGISSGAVAWACRQLAGRSSRNRPISTASARAPEPTGAKVSPSAASAIP